MLNFTPSLNTAIRETTEYKHFIHPVDKALDQNLSQGYKPMKNLRCTCTLTNLQLLQSPRCMCKSLRHFPGTSPLNYFEPLQHLCKLEGFVWCTLKTKILHIRLLIYCIYCILGFRIVSNAYNRFATNLKNTTYSLHTISHYQDYNSTLGFHRLCHKYR